MKLFLLTVLIGLTTGAKLSNNYLPPHSAGSAGGHGSFLQGPQSSPSNQYIPPSTNFNQQGQPVQWSHGGWNSGSSGQGGASWSGNSNSLGSGSSQQGWSSGGGSNGYQKPSAPVIPIIKYNNQNDGNGNYQFEYETGNGIRAEEHGHINNANTDWAENVVKGSYSYTGDDGKQYSVSYTADSNGFQAFGAHLPTAPQYTPEVQAIWDKVLAEQALTAQQGGGAWQQSGADNSGWQQGGAGAGGGGGSGWQQKPSHTQQRPQTPQNQYLPPGNSGYRY